MASESLEGSKSLEGPKSSDDLEQFLWKPLLF